VGLVGSRGFEETSTVWARSNESSMRGGEAAKGGKGGTNVTACSEPSLTVNWAWMVMGDMIGLIRGGWRLKENRCLPQCFRRGKRDVPLILQAKFG
jgi:hypothetical protein